MNDVQDILKQIISITGVGSKKEKATQLFLRLSAITLTLASGYTTFNGFSQYTPFFIALLLTLGVQGLLYSSAWKIGSAIRSNNLKILQVVIFSVTMVVSVFFSYASLLEVIYKKELRLEDELTDRQNQVATAISSIKDSISYKVDLTKTYDDFKSQLIIWNDSSSYEVAKYFGNLTTALDKSTARQKALEYSLIKNKQNYLNNPDSLNRLLYSNSRSRETNHRENRLFPTLTKFERCRILQIEHDSIYKVITSDNRLITIGNISDFQQKKKELYPLVLGNRYISNSIELPDTLKEQLIKISELNNFYDFIDSFKVEDYSDIRKLKFKSLKLIDKLPNSFKIDFSKIKASLLNLDKYTGSNQHQFVASVMLIKQEHILGIGALTIAFLIDLLVLFCGILGALPSSYLTLKSEDDIDAVMESSLINVFSIDGQNLDGVLKQKLHLILSNSEPASVDNSIEGYPAVLAREKINRLNLAADIGILIATSQARSFNESEDVHLRTRFILWAAEKLNMQ